jgi:uncharacterized protein YjbJ (UPF0337 family)
MTHKNIHKAKGRVKESAGALTGSRRLKNEGRVDQAKGSAKSAVDMMSRCARRSRAAAGSRW